MLEDTIFTIGNIIFSISLLPIIKENIKLRRCDIPYKTSLITGITIYFFSIAFFNLKLYFSSIASLLTFTSWIIIACQRYIYSG